MFAAFFLWGMASQAYGAIQDIQADRAADISSIATVFGARRTIRIVAVLYMLAGLLLVFAGPKIAWTAVLVVPYLALMVVPFWQVNDQTCELTNKGWRRFLWINYAVGAVLTFGTLAMVRYF